MQEIAYHFFFSTFINYTLLYINVGDYMKKRFKAKKKFFGKLQKVFQEIVHGIEPRAAFGFCKSPLLCICPTFSNCFFVGGKARALFSFYREAPAFSGENAGVLSGIGRRGSDGGEGSLPLFLRLCDSEKQAHKGRKEPRGFQGNNLQEKRSFHRWAGLPLREAKPTRRDD